MFGQSEKKKNRQLREQFMPQYEAFVQEHGTLFEEIQEPLNATEITYLRSQKKIFLGFIILLGVLFLCLTFFTWHTISTEDLWAALFVPVLAFAFVWYFKDLKKATESGVKVTTKGIVTNKRKPDDDTTMVEVSARKEIEIPISDYNTLEFGDIIKVEQLQGNQSTFRVILTRLSKI
jgi:hypothetical protein